MGRRISLEGIWKLRGEFLDVGPERVQEVLNREDGEFNVITGRPNVFPVKKGFMKAKVPGDVMTALIEQGILKEPFLKDYSKDCLWVKDLSWWFIKEFDISEELYNNDELRLHIEMLDFKADIIINGVPAGKHRNTFCAFEEDIRRFLKVGKNQIVIRLTSGIEDFYPKDSISFYCASPHAIYDQRVYLRKPQFTYGWDWCQPVPTCGIGRQIYIEGINGGEITAFRADTLNIDDKQNAQVKLCFQIDKTGMCSSDEAKLAYQISFNGNVIIEEEKEYYLTGGLNFIEETVLIPHAKLWWPNGYGEQNQYEVNAVCTCLGVSNQMISKKIGIRTVEINHSKLEDGTRNFYFIVNGVRVFCKGGNLVPADSLYLRTPDSTYETLVKEGKAANFTMFRIWGGGTYEPDCFYEYCSEAGILIMHDFMYACGYYPDHLDWFLYEAEREADYQTRRLAHYACMAVWTGNNEIHESYTDWFKEPIQADRYYGIKIFNYIQPKAVKNNCPLIPYMPSSPYFGNRANAVESGDIHAWNHYLRNKETGFSFLYELEVFDRVPARFSSEYGFFGAQMESTVRRYLDGEEMKFDNPVWKHHGEYDRKRESIDGVINRHLTDFSGLDERGYLLYSGVMQGCLYRELAEAIRIKPYGSGDLIWMYNDCWPETGWTVIDYYLTRKISFYFLKRSFAFKKFIIRKTENGAAVTMINETDKTLSIPVEFGFMTFTGVKSGNIQKNLIMNPHSFQQFYFENAGDCKNGFYYIFSEDAGMEPATSLRAYYRDYNFPEAIVNLEETEKDGKDLVVTVRSNNYVPVAYLKLPDDRVKLSDNYFELLPGVKKQIRIYNCQEIPEVCQVKMKPGNIV